MIALLEIKADGTGLREIRKLTDESSFRWSLMRSMLCINPEMLHSRTSGCFPCRRGFFAARGNRLTHEWTAALLASNSEPGREADFCPRYKAARRTGALRHGIDAFLPFLSGISATDPTFSRDGKWVAYAIYPEHTLWRSRSDGTERMQLTFAPMDVRFSIISPDGTKVSFHTERNEIFVIDMQGGQPQKVTDDAVFASWSPDGNYLLYARGFGLQMTDLRTGKNTAVPSSVGMSGGLAQPGHCDGPWPKRNELRDRRFENTAAG